VPKGIPGTEYRRIGWERGRIAPAVDAAGLRSTTEHWEDGIMLLSGGFGFPC
jgi:hypothetical protein